VITPVENQESYSKLRLKRGKSEVESERAASSQKRRKGGGLRKTEGEKKKEKKKI